MTFKQEREVKKIAGLGQRRRGGKQRREIAKKIMLQIIVLIAIKAELDKVECANNFDVYAKSEELINTICRVIFYWIYIGAFE